MASSSRVGTALLVAVSCAASSAHGIPSPKEKWLRVRSQHFTLVSNTDSEDATEAVFLLEHFRAVLEGKTSEEAAYVPTTIIVFKNQETFRPYKLNHQGQPDTYLGKFTSSPDGNYIGMSVGENDDPYGTVLHEYVHWFISKSYVEIPLWVNEGMAEYYSTFRIEKGEIQIGRPIEDHLRWLGENPLIPLPELFTITPDSKVYNEGTRAGVFYSESWALYHYMRLGRPELLPKLVSFLESLQVGTNVNQAWRNAFGVGYEPIEAELKRYVGGGTYPFKRLRVVELDEHVQVEPMAYADLLSCLGEYLVHATPWEVKEGEAHLRTATTVDPTNWRAHTALACVLADAGHRSEANEHFQKAVELAGGEDEPYFRWGASKIRVFQAGKPRIYSRADSLPAELRLARELLVRCIALKPNRVEAYIDIGSTYLFDPGDVSEGVSALRAALSLIPSRMDACCYLVELLLRQGDRATAQGLMDNVLVHSTDARWLEMAQEAMYAHAIEQYNAQHYGTTIEILDWLEPRVDTNLIGRIQGLRAETDRQSSGQREVDEYNRQVDLYNEAISKANANDLESAIQILEKLLPEVKNPELANQVRKTLDSMHAAGSSRSSGRR